MRHQEYERVIGEWCEATGMQPWPTTEDMNVTLEGTTVGLLFDPDVGEGVLHVLIDLQLPRTPDLERQLLMLNYSMPGKLPGCYAQHPETGDAVWRADIPITPDLQGEKLPALIAEMFDAARAQLR